MELVWEADLNCYQSSTISTVRKHSKKKWDHKLQTIFHGSSFCHQQVGTEHILTVETAKHSKYLISLQDNETHAADLCSCQLLICVLCIDPWCEAGETRWWEQLKSDANSQLRMFKGETENYNVLCMCQRRRSVFLVSRYSELRVGDVWRQHALSVSVSQDSCCWLTELLRFNITIQFNNQRLYHQQFSLHRLDSGDYNWWY